MLTWQYPWSPIHDRVVSITKACGTYTQGQTQTVMVWLRLAERRLKRYKVDNCDEYASLKTTQWNVADAMRAVRERRVALLKMGKVELV